jgi:hypothetical protein
MDQSQGAGRKNKRAETGQIDGPAFARRYAGTSLHRAAVGGALHTSYFLLGASKMETASKPATAQIHHGSGLIVTIVNLPCGQVIMGLPVAETASIITDPLPGSSLAHVHEAVD